MFTQSEITSLQARILKRAADTGAWRAAGRTEKYLEAFCDVGSMDNRLDQLFRDEGVSNPETSGMTSEVRPRARDGTVIR